MGYNKSALMSIPSEMVFHFTLSDSSLVYCTYRSSVDVASKPYFLAGSNRKQIVFDRTSTERLVDKINDPLENIFLTPLIVFSVVECETVAPFFLPIGRKTKTELAYSCELPQVELATVCGRLPIAFLSTPLPLDSFWTSRSCDCLL